MKRIFGALAAVAMLLPLGACDANRKQPGPGGEVTIQFSSWETGAGKQVLTDAVKRFEEQNPGIKVDMIFIPAEYQIKLTAMSVSNTLPDAGYFTESSVLLWAENGKLLDLSAMFEEEPLNTKLDMVRFVNREGKIMAASVANEIALLFYDKKLFDKAGVPYPPARAEEAWTWNEFVDAAKKLTKDRRGNTAGSSGFDANRIATYGVNLYQNNLVFETLMWSNGGGIVDYETEEILFDKPETIEVLQAIQDLIHVHHVSPTPVMQGTLPTIASALTSGTVAMCIDMQNNILLLDEAAKSEGLDYGIGVLPKFKEPVSVNGGSPIVIFKDTKYPEEAKKLFEFLMNPENVLPLINNGLWMPNETDWYTDEGKISRWIGTDVHVPEYRTAVVDYTMSGAVRRNSYFYYPYSPHLLGAVYPAIEKVYLNSAKPAAAVAEVIQNLKDTIDFVNSPDFSG